MKKFLSLLLALAMLCSLLTACGSGNNSQGGDGSNTEASGTDTEGAGPSDTTVTIGIADNMYPVYPSSSNSEDFIGTGMVYDFLFEVTADGEYVSKVLESYEWTDDVTLVMTVKDGIYFSDGQQMTADDVLFSLKNYVDQGQTSDKYVYYQYIDFDASTVSEDGMTLTLVYSQPYGPALRSLNCAIMERSFTEAHDNTDDIWLTGPVGSGPYEITECVKDSYWVFTLREDYWDADSTYDATQITLKFYSDETAMYVDYQAGNLDCIYYISSTIVDQIEAAGGSQGTVQYYTDNNTVLLALNANSQYLSDPVVREAIAYAIDTSYIAEVCYGSLGVPATSHFASSFECYTDHSGEYTYDVAKAQQLLTDAGYSSGEITIAWISPDIPPQPDIAECLQAMLDAVGIKLDIQTYELGTALQTFIEGTAEMSNITCNGGNPTCEPDNLLSSTCIGAAFTSFIISDPAYDALYQTGLTSVDETARWDAYTELDQWLYDNFMMIPLVETQSAVAYNSRIAEFPQGAINRSCLGDLKLA